MNAKALPHQVRTPDEWGAWAQAMERTLPGPAELAWLVDDAWGEHEHQTNALAPETIASGLAPCAGHALRWIEVRERVGPSGARRKVRIEAGRDWRASGRVAPRWRTNLDAVQAEQAFRETVRSSPAQPSATEPSARPGTGLEWLCVLGYAAAMAGCFTAIAAGEKGLAMAFVLASIIAGFAGIWIWNKRAMCRVRAGWGLGVYASEAATAPGSRVRARPLSVWRMAADMLWAVGFVVVGFFFLVMIWVFALDVVRDAFKLDEVEWWNREIEYAELWRWLTGR